MRYLKGRSVELHQLEDVHIPILYKWRASDDFMDLCSTRRNHVSFHDFQAELDSDFQRDRHAQYLIVKRGEHAGTVYSYNLSRTDGHVFITIFLVREWRDKGVGVEAIVVFLEYLFQQFDLYKVYADVYSYNYESINTLIRGGFVEEGRFRGHRLHHNERHDLLRFALYRNTLRTSMNIIHRLTGRSPSDWI